MTPYVLIQTPFVLTLPASFVSQPRCKVSLPEYFMYDGNGNVVLEQNGVMREKNMWKEYTYDHADRLLRERMLTDKDGSCLVWDGSQVVLKGTAVDMNGTGRVLRLCGYDTPKSGMLGFEDAEGVVTSSDIRAGNAGRLTLESVFTTEGGIGTDRSYYYDRHGNAAQVVERLSDGSVLRTSLSRDLQGRPVRKETVHDDRSGTVHTLSQRFSYDVSGRLLSETSVLDGCEAVVTCGYDASGRLVRRTCGDGAAEETVTRNLQGWETGRTVVVSGGAEAYSSRLTYYDVGLSATPSYTGNISTWSWRREGGSEIGYAYEYDALGRLVSASGHADGIPSESVDTERDIVYDRNGNILGMTRVLGGEPCRLTYVYDGNRRTGEDYMYDSGGNMEADMESLTMAEYSFLNQPKLLFGGQGHELVSSCYLSDGTKTRTDMAKTHRGYMYAGPFRYRSDGGGDYRLDMVRFGGGRFQTDSEVAVHAVYSVTDHLGSVRLEVGGDGETVGRYDYLPFGTLASTCDASGGNNMYLYTGKEYQDGLDVSWYDSGARYQTVHGIFTSPDPLAEDCPHLSPYVYCADNPVNLIDPDGKTVNLSELTDRNHRIAFSRFIQTSVGNAFVRRFMAKGESIDVNGFKIIATEDGDRAKDSFCIYSTDFYGDASIRGQTALYVRSNKDHKSQRIGGPELGQDIEGGYKCSITEVIYLNTINMTVAEAAAVLGHEVFVHTEGFADAMTKKINAGKFEGSLYKNLTDLSSAGSEEHTRLSQGKIVSYRRYLYELAKEFNNRYYIKYYNDDVQRYK